MWGSLSLRYLDQSSGHDQLVEQPLPAVLSFLVHYGCRLIELASSYSATVAVLFCSLLRLRDVFIYVTVSLKGGFGPARSPLSMT